MGTEKKVNADKVEMVTKKGLMNTLRKLFVKEEAKVKVEKNIRINRNGIIVHCKNCKCNVFSRLEGGNYSCNRCGTVYNVVKDE